ncbi:MAG: S24 family peptidase [Nitrospirota bacterium]
MTRFSKENTFSRAAIGRRVREIRGTLASQAFAARLGVSPGFVNEIEHGRKKPSAEMLFALEAEFGVDANWVLRGGDGSQGAAEAAPRYGTGIGSEPRRGNLPIPVYRQDAEGRALHAEPTELRLPLEYSGREVIAVALADDSMAPTAAAGSLVGVDRGRTRVADGDPALVELGGTASPRTLVRRVYRTRAGIRLRADNDLVAETVVPARRLRILGKVVWVLRRTAHEPPPSP